jgi:hypothetical protein
MRWVRMPGVRPIMAVVAAAFVSATAAATVSINIGSTSGKPGATVTFQVTVSGGGADVGGVQNTILFEPATPIASCAIQPALAGISGWTLRPQDCTPLVSCTQAHFVILPDLFGSVIPDGLLYQCDVKIAASAPGGVFPLRCSEEGAGEPGGQVLPVQCVEGQVEVVRPTPTTTPVATVCNGDCDGNHLVTVDEILKMVKIALDNGPPGACEAGDANHDGKITVDDIVAAVSAALNTCGPG